MWKRFTAKYQDLRSLLMVGVGLKPGLRSPSDGERRVAVAMQRESIQRELGNRSPLPLECEEPQQLAYWRLWRLLRSDATAAIPPEVLDASVPEHVSLALTIVGEYDAAREDPGEFADCLYNRELLAKERDALGLALFSLDYFLDSPASGIPREKFENLEYVKHRQPTVSVAAVDPHPGDVIIRSGFGETDHVDQVIGVCDNDEWMVLTSSGNSMQIVRNGEPGKWDEVMVVAPEVASWLTLTPSGGTPTS